MAQVRLRNRAQSDGVRSEHRRKSVPPPHCTPAGSRRGCRAFTACVHAYTRGSPAVSWRAATVCVPQCRSCAGAAALALRRRGREGEIPEQIRNLPLYKTLAEADDSFWRSNGAGGADDDLDPDAPDGGGGRATSPA